MPPEKEFALMPRTIISFMSKLTLDALTIYIFLLLNGESRASEIGEKLNIICPYFHINILEKLGLTTYRCNETNDIMYFKVKEEDTFEPTKE